jgi:molecular chaperone GrpE
MEQNNQNKQEDMENQTADSCCHVHDSSEKQEETLSLEDELANMKDQWLRAVAESENLRRRAQKEKEDALKYAAVTFARDMITITDYIEQALASMEKSNAEDIKPFLTGVQMTANELQNVFSRHGIKKIDPLNKKFDPNLHQAMMEVESQDQEPGEIVSIMQHGYTMHDRLLRPSMVTVAKKIS